MCVHFFMKYKWQTNWWYQITTFAIKRDRQMAEVLFKKPKGKPHLFLKT